MKTIANIIIIDSQNVKSEHLLAVVITLLFNEESSVSPRTSSTEVANTRLPKLPLDNLKSISLRHLAELHAIATSYCMEYKCMQFLYQLYI